MALGTLHWACWPAPAPAAAARTQATAPGLATDWALRIERGDTLVAITRRLLNPPHGWRDLKRHNRIANPRRLVPGSWLLIPLDWLRRDSAVAVVLHVHGQAQLQDDGAGQPLRLGQTLAAGARLRTGADSAIALRFVDGSHLLITPHTRVTLDTLQQQAGSGASTTRLQLQQGAVESRVPPAAASAPRRYEIRTPVLTLGVRGTVFRVASEAVDPPTSRLEVLQGEVQAAADRTLPVAAGLGVVASRGAPLGEPAPLLPAPELAGPPAQPATGELALQWKDVAGATAYRVQLFDGAEGENLVRDARWPATSARWEALPPGDYKLRLRAVAATGLEGLDTQAGVSVAALVPTPPQGPRPPRRGLPLDGQQLDGTTVPFTWYAAEPGRRYRLQVATTADFATPVHDQTGTAAAPYNLVQLSVSLPPGRYHWRVASVDDAGVAGAFSPAGRFDLRLRPP